MRGPAALGGFALLLDLFLFGVNLDLLVLDVEPQVVVDAHILICHPDQGKQSNQISPPAVVEQLESRNDQKKCGNVLTEAVFAGKQIIKLAARQVASLFRSALAIVPRLTEYFFVGDRPRDAGHGYR